MLSECKTCTGYVYEYHEKAQNSCLWLHTLSLFGMTGEAFTGLVSGIIGQSDHPPACLTLFTVKQAGSG